MARAPRSPFPARTDPACLAIYDQAFAGVAHRVASPRLHLVGLGSGSGQKEARLLGMLNAKHRSLSSPPTNCSLALPARITRPHSMPSAKFLAIPSYATSPPPKTFPSFSAPRHIPETRA